MATREDALEAIALAEAMSLTMNGLFMLARVTDSAVMPGLVEALRKVAAGLDAEVQCEVLRLANDCSRCEVPDADVRVLARRVLENLSNVRPLAEWEDFP